MMNTTVVSFYTPDMSEVGEITSAANKKFAARHGFEHRIPLLPISAEDAVWAKLDLVYEELSRGNNVWWIDADAAVMNPESKPLLPCDRVTASYDINGLNTGVFYAPANDRVLRYFYACRTHGRTLFDGRKTGDQISMQHFVSHVPYLELIDYAPTRVMQSYWPGAYDYPFAEADHYQAGDFILHLPGMSNSDRVRIFEEVLGGSTSSPGSSSDFLPEDSMERC
jgi:hypothetical protein